MCEAVGEPDVSIMKEDPIEVNHSQGIFYVPFEISLLKKTWPKTRFDAAKSRIQRRYLGAHSTHHGPRQIEEENKGNSSRWKRKSKGENKRKRSTSWREARVHRIRKSTHSSTDRMRGECAHTTKL